MASIRAISWSKRKWGRCFAGKVLENISKDVSDRKGTHSAGLHLSSSLILLRHHLNMARSSNVRDFNQKRKREREEAGGKRKRPKKFVRQGSYHSGSEDEDDVQINLDTSATKGLLQPEMSGGNTAPLNPAPVRDGKPTTLPDAPVEEDDEDDSGVAVDEDDNEVDDEDEEDEDGLEDGNDELNLDDLSSNDEASSDAEAEDDNSDDDNSDSLSDTTSTASANRRKRNDPARFATSINKILSSKLTTTKRADPVLSRSKAATEASADLAESKLEAKARRKLRTDKQNAMEKGRVRDVLGLESTVVSTGEIAEQERRLRKMAQRGVVKLFNAVRSTLR